MALHPILHGRRYLSDYAGFAPPEMLAAIRWLAHPLVGLRVLHLSSGRFGGPIAEMLASAVPLQRDVGMIATWQVVTGVITRNAGVLHRGLTGAGVGWEPADADRWYAEAEGVASAVNAADHDVIVFHDPELLAMGRVLHRMPQRPLLVWHCHLDMRDAQPTVWESVRSALRSFDAVLFPSPGLLRDDVPVPYVGVARPGLDPCSPKNLVIEPSVVSAVSQRYGIDPARPVIGQFAPIDDRYAPVRALDVYWLARRDLPGLQIVLAEPCVGAAVGPEADVRRVTDAAGDDPDIHVLSTRAGLGAVEINALQRCCAVAVQLTGPCGHAWGIAECQLKGKPAVVGAGCKIPWSVLHGIDGLVADGTPEAAAGAVRLLRDASLATTMGDAARRRASEAAVVCSLLPDYVRAFRALTATTKRKVGA